MDPNENIKRQRELAAQILRLRTIEELQDNCESMRELAELVQALDEWRLKGGFDPYTGAMSAPVVLATWADDPAQHEPFLICQECGETLCSVEEGDEFVVLARVVTEHQAERHPL